MAERDHLYTFEVAADLRLAPLTVRRFLRLIGFAAIQGRRAYISGRRDTPNR